MPGFRPRNTHVGDRAEYLGTFLLSWVAQALPVPRQEDYGIDFQGGLLREVGTRINIGRRFSVQFKSNAGDIFKPVGGVETRRGKSRWRQDDVKWLLGRSPFPVDPTPLFFAHVDVRSASLALYSPAPMWNARWLGYPTEVQFDASRWPPIGELDFGRSPFELKALADCYPKGFPSPAPGLKKRVVVPIGGPVVRISAKDAAEPDADARRLAVVHTLDEWIRLDTLNRLAAILEVPVCFWHAGWRANEPPNPGHQAWSSYAHPDAAAGLPAANIESSLRPFVEAWDRVREVQGEPSLLRPEFRDNAIIDQLRGGGPVARAVEIDRLRGLSTLPAPPVESEGQEDAGA